MRQIEHGVRARVRAITSSRHCREAEAAFCQERDEKDPGHEWERICRQAQDMLMNCYDEIVTKSKRFCCYVMTKQRNLDV